MTTLTPIRTAAIGLLALASLLLIGGAVDTALAPKAGATNGSAALLKPVCGPRGQYQVKGSVTNQWDWPLTVQFDHNTGTPIGYDSIAPGETRAVSFTMLANSTFTWTATGWFNVGPDGNVHSEVAHITGGPWTLTTGNPCTQPPTAPTTSTTCPPGFHDDAPVSPCAADAVPTTAVEIATPTTIPVVESTPSIAPPTEPGTSPTPTALERTGPPRTAPPVVQLPTTGFGDVMKIVAVVGGLLALLGGAALLASRKDRARRKAREDGANVVLLTDEEWPTKTRS